MDTGTGHIWERDKIKIKDIKGELVPWEVGEEVIVKNCKFTVKEIKVFPEDEIVLKGKANIPIMEAEEMFKKNSQFEPVESDHKIIDFARHKRG